MIEREDSASDLARRLERLERTVAALERRLQARGADPATLPVPRTARPTISLVPADPGQWVNRLGIGLLLLGAAFGFKYSIDHGWIGPSLRVLSGLGLAVVLLIASAGMRRTRPGLSRVLAGGGIASGYLSIYAAFQLYDLVSHTSAFAAMSIVTAAAFLLALRDDDARMATLATIGGLATPFVLYTTGRDLSGLVGYTCLIVAGAGAVFTARGWRVVLWTAALGGWLVLASAASQVQSAFGATAGAGVVQAGVMFVALGTWWLAVIREMLCAENPGAWRQSSFGFAEDAATGMLRRAGDHGTQSHQLTLATPILVLALSTWLWKLEDTSSGWLALSLAAGWSAAAVHLRSISAAAARRLAATHGLGAAVMLAFALSFLLGEDARSVGIAAEALALLVLSSRAGDPRSALLAHALFVLVTLESQSHILADIGRETSRAIGTPELAALGVIVVLAAAAFVQTGALRIRYFHVAQAALLVWILRALDPLPNGAALVTAAWFLNAVVLMIAGLRSDSAPIRTAGAAVMALTMGKLFFFDMSTVDAGWRIVTFLGFGAALLGLGYAFPALWRRKSGTGTDL